METRAVPLEDTGFDTTTPLPDPDLVVVREKAYGAGGVDLSSYGFGTPDFVQSVYLRFFVDNDGGTADSFAGRILFPEGVTVLGIILDDVELGGSSEDGVASETDSLFGVASDPDDYSEQARGFECCGGIGSSEFVCQVDDRTIVYGLNITSGIDDFRIIIDYGDSFPEGLAFDIDTYLVNSLGGAVPSEGIRVGLAGSAVPGSGDFGEVAGLRGIPLTASGEPSPADAITFQAESNLFLLRDTSGDAFVDGFDFERSIPAPDRYRISVLPHPVGITDGPDGLVYVFDEDGGYGVAYPESDSARSVSIADLPGNTKGVTDLPGSRSLFLVRDTSGDTYVDHFQVDTETFSAADTISSTLVAVPVGITDGADGRLWVLGSGAGMAAVDPVTGLVTDRTLSTNPPGSYIGLTGTDAGDVLYFLRDAGPEASVDLYVIESDSLVLDHVVIPMISTPVDIADGPGDRLFVLGTSPSGDRVVATLSTTTAAVVDVYACLQFTGSIRSMTARGGSQQIGLPPREAPTPPPFAHWVTPTPFRSSTRISFRLEQSAKVRLDLFSIAGRRVATLVQDRLPAGTHTTAWNGRDATGREVASGVYLYRISADAATATGRVLRIR